MNSIVCWLNAPTGRCEAAPVINDRRILIVEDNPDDESLTQRGLRPAGAAVVVTRDGALALETLAAMVSGLAPGSEALTRIVGKSTCGKGATGSNR